MLGGKKIVGLCTTRINTPTSHMMITTLNSSLRGDDYSLFVYSTSTDLYWNTPSEEGEKSVFDLIDFDILDVLIVMYEMIKDRALSDSLIERAKTRGIPVFVVEGHVEGCINVNFDYRNGFERMVRHVIETHAVRKPHFMAGIKGNPFSEERLEVFKNVLEEHNIPFSEDMVSYGDFWSWPAMRATEAIVESGKLPEAIICANDTMAVAVCSILKHHFIDVPQDILVTGFDGIDDVQFVSPTISTYRCSNREVAEKIAHIIRTDDIPEEGEDIYILPAEDLGQSCGCVREVHFNAADHLTALNDRFNRYQGEEHHLFRMSAKVLTCKNADEIAALMKDAGFYDMTCILRRECIDSTVDPLTVPECRDCGTGIVLYDTDAPVEEFSPYEFNCADIIPDLHKQLDDGGPLIFAALNFLNIPLGYLCFHFHNDDIDNYFKIPQTVNILDNAIGGFRNMRYQQYLNDRMEELYRLDSLTGLYNRNALVKIFEEAEEGLRRSGKPITFILSDLDRLKYINDTFGHAEGDFAIRAVADALRSVCPQNAVLARWGGDEMVAFFEGECDEAEIKSGMSGYLDKLTGENGRTYEITSSVGVVTAVLGENDALDSVTKDADRLMYADKLAKKRSREE